MIKQIITLGALISFASIASAEGGTVLPAGIKINNQTKHYYVVPKNLIKGKNVAGSLKMKTAPCDEGNVQTITLKNQNLKSGKFNFDLSAVDQTGGKYNEYSLGNYKFATSSENWILVTQGWGKTFPITVDKGPFKVVITLDQSDAQSVFTFTVYPKKAEHACGN